MDGTGLPARAPFATTVHWTESLVYVNKTYINLTQRSIGRHLVSNECLDWWVETGRGRGRV